MSVQEPINAKSQLNLDVLVIGAGVSGMLLALECKRLGLNPTIIERRPIIEAAGDFVVIGDSAVKVFKHWPQLMADYEENSYKVDAYYSRHNGEHIVGPIALKSTTGRPLVRRRLIQLLESAVLRQKIPILFNKKVTSYFETEKLGGVEFADGGRMTADIVAACDGLHSSSWKVITEEKYTTVSSGSAVYRTSVSADYVFRKDPSLKEHFELRDGQAYLKWFNGPSRHGLVFSDGENICWSVHHPANENTSSENWSATVDSQLVAEQLCRDHPDWSPALMSLIRNTPNGTINDWLLLFRDPEPNWVSSLGRIVQCGDSAHPFLPTSANGATQAMEDAATLGAVIRLGVDSKCTIKESLQVYNTLRFERTSCAQLMGAYFRQIHHDTDWDKVKQRPEILTNVGPGKWISQHDPEQYAIHNFEECLAGLKTGQFRNTNTPPGFKYKPWTCAEILRLQAEKVHFTLDGDWN